MHLRVIGPRDRDVDLVHNLEHSRHFLLPRIVGETAESEGGPNQRLEPVSASNRVNFDLLADYNPASPEERKRATEEICAPHPRATAMTIPTQRHRKQRTAASRSPYTGMPRPRVPVQPDRGGRDEPEPRHNARTACFSAHLALRGPRRDGPDRAGLAVRLGLDWSATDSSSTDALVGKQIELKTLELQTAPLRGLDERVENRASRFRTSTPSASRQLLLHLSPSAT